MRYLSTTEVSKIWGICPRRIQVLCANDRVPGASRVGNTWIIPEGTEKPKDARIRNGRYVRSQQLAVKEEKQNA